jgi:hypothetical protein
VRVLTTKPEAFFDHLGTQAGSGGPAVTAVIPGDEDLEAVFRYLTR